jgi:hypothetical protein
MSDVYQPRAAFWLFYVKSRQNVINDIDFEQLFSAGQNWTK